LKKQQFTPLIILAFIASFMFLKVYLDKHKTRNGVLDFKGCKAQFTYRNMDIDKAGFNHSLDFIKAKRTVAACLCEKYLLRKDTSVASMILLINHSFATSWFDKHPEHNQDGRSETNLDSILKYRKEVFDPTGHNPD